MDASTLLRDQLRDAHAALERTVAGLGEAELGWIPPGTANPIGATLAHVVVAEDVLVHAIFQGGAPLLASTWAGRTGLSEPMPMPGPITPKPTAIAMARVFAESISIRM